MTRMIRKNGKSRLMIAGMTAIMMSTSLVAYEDNALSLIGSRQQNSSDKDDMTQHMYAGTWITEDGRVRHQLLPNGRYDEARGDRESAYRGRYEVQGDHIEYWDDTGFTSDGNFIDPDTLHHGVMILRWQ